MFFSNLENAKETDKTNDTFVERMQLQIIRNLELSIRNIHIVYEDKSTKPNHPFAFGITLNYISFHVINFPVFSIELFIGFLLDNNTGLGTNDT